MITEDYVSFETAKLLKEKGFDGECRTYYQEFPVNMIAVIRHSCLIKKTTDLEPNEVLCPTLQMAMKWLREVHDAIINVFYDEDEDRWCAEHYRRLMDDYTLIGYGDTYEQACEAAIKYCLENLI